MDKTFVAVIEHPNGKYIVKELGANSEHSLTISGYYSKPGTAKGQITRMINRSHQGEIVAVSPEEFMQEIYRRHAQKIAGAWNAS